LDQARAIARALDRARAIAPAPARARSPDRDLEQAEAHRAASFPTFSIYRMLGAEMLVAGYQVDSAARPLDSAARWPAARRRTFSAIDQAMPCQEKGAGLAAAISRAICPPAQASAMVSDLAAAGPTSVAPGNPAIVPTIACRAKAIDQTSAGQDGQISGSPGDRILGSQAVQTLGSRVVLISDSRDGLTSDNRVVLTSVSRVVPISADREG